MPWGEGSYLSLVFVKGVFKVGFSFIRLILDLDLYGKFTAGQIGNFEDGVYATLYKGEISRSFLFLWLILPTDLTDLIGQTMTHSSSVGSGEINCLSFLRIFIIGFLGTKAFFGVILAPVAELFRERIVIGLSLSLRFEWLPRFRG